MRIVPASPGIHTCPSCGGCGHNSDGILVVCGDFNRSLELSKPATKCLLCGGLRKVRIERLTKEEVSGDKQ